MISHGIFLFLTYFTWYDHLWVQPCCCKWHYFILFLWLGQIVLYIHYIFIYPCVNEHLGCLQDLSIVNSAAVNIRVSFRSVIFSEYMPRSQITEFPVVMYGCESWTIKKAECQRIDAFEGGVGEDS